MSERSPRKAKVGPPYKYTRKEIKEIVVPKYLELSKQGYPEAGIAGKLGISKETLYEWFDKYPELSDARREGASIKQAFYHELGMNATMGKIKGFNSTTYIWLTKNCAGWRDTDRLQTQEVTVTKEQVSYKTSWGGNEEPSDES